MSIVLTDYHEVDSARLCRCAVEGAKSYLMDLPDSLSAEQRQEVVGVVHGAVETALMNFYESERKGISEGTYQLLSEEIAEALKKRVAQP